jgi:ribosomal protein L16 Arg81 hydroxylase
MTIQKCSSLLSPKEIYDVFTSSKLFELNSFNVLEKEKRTYNKNRERNSYIEESKYIFEKYNAGHTIIVKNLEFFNESIRNYCLKFKSETNVHMYLVPPNGQDSFPYHKDTRDVTIHLIYGKKVFYLKDENEKETEFELTAGDELFIKNNSFHKAVPKSGSCLLSFGTKSMTNYEIPTLFNLSDFS